MTRKHKRLRLTPSHLPLIRDKVAAFQKEQLKRQMDSMPQYERYTLEMWNELDQLKTAQLWWVSHDMVQLVTDTVLFGTFPEVEYPAVTGLMFFDGGLPLNLSDGTLSGNIVALYWSCGRDGQLATIPFTDGDDVLEQSGAKAAGLPMTCPVIYVDETNQPGLAEAFAKIVKATWALSSQPRICQTKPAQPGGRYPMPPRFDSEIRKVKMLILRENLHRPGESDKDDERVRREYSHRFIVRGFWREQAYGPNHTLRRRQWIPPFVKGPADKPLICKETVRVWKR